MKEGYIWVIFGLDVSCVGALLVGYDNSYYPLWQLLL